MLFRRLITSSACIAHGPTPAFLMGLDLRALCRDDEVAVFRVDQKKLQAAEWRDGHYLLRSNLTAGDPSVLWTRCVQLTQIESAFRSPKSELGIRPIYHQLEHRADTHILIAFLAYCLQMTLKQAALLLHASGLTLTAVLEKLREIQMIGVWIPTVDQRWLGICT